MRFLQSIKFGLWAFSKRLNYKQFGLNILSVFGALWLLVEILAFFGQKTLSENLQKNWAWFLGLGIILIIYKSWPQRTFLFKIQNRDVNLSLVIDDVFRINGAIIIPINNHLDCINNGLVMRANSILKHFIVKKYNGNPNHLNADILQELEDKTEWYSNYVLDAENNEYKVGTVVPIFVDETQFYLLCNSTLNQQGRAKSTTDNLQDSLNELWSYLSINGSKDNLVIPLIGTGRGRIPMKREEVIKEIILSFLVSLSQENYCDQLTICIHPSDFKKYNLDLDGIIAFMRLHCNNTIFLSPHRMTERKGSALN